MLASNIFKKKIHFNVKKISQNTDTWKHTLNQEYTIRMLQSTIKGQQRPPLLFWKFRR
jgi:hypothetical protein